MTPQERLDALLADVWVPTDTLVTIGMIRDEIGLTVEQYGLVRGTLEKAITILRADIDPAKKMQGLDLQDALAAMLSRGISLGSENRQQTIDLLAQLGQWPDALRDKVKALGGVYRKQWQVEGYETEPTLSQLTKEAIVTATRKAIEDALKPIQQKSTAINGWMDAVDLATYSEAELQAYCDSLLASSDGNGGGE